MRTPTCLLASLLLSAASAPASTFSVTNAGATFTITRSGDTSASGTVRYRTVPLTAYPGQHYTAKSDTLVFAPGQTSTNLAVSEPSSTTIDAYRYQTGGRRSYRFEVDDENGFTLASCDRSRQCGSIFSYGKLNTSVSSLVTLTSAGAFSSGMSSSKYVDVAYTPPSGDVQGSGKTLEGYVLIDDSYDYAQKPATVSTATLVDATGATGSYLASMGCKIHAAVCFAEKEKDDGYQYLQIVAGDSTASYDTGADPNGGVKDPTNSVYKVCFEFADGSNAEGNIYFPHRGTTSSEFSNSAGKLHQHKYKSGYGGSGAVVLPATTASITARFDAGGDNDDTWGYKDLFFRMALCDTVAPALYGGSSAGVVVAPGTYAVGSTVYVSVPFNEIVRVAGTPTLSTTWGTLSYAAGDGSNVLTFQGRIEAKTGVTLKVNSLSGTVRDLAGNSLAVPLSINTTYPSCVSQIPWSGSGTPDAPYLILTTGQLDALAILVDKGEQYSSSTHFSLGADLAYPHTTAWDDATSTENNFTPVGGYAKSFGGHFHGNGHTVSGIRIYRSGDTLDKGDSSLALFGYASGGSVRDVVVADANVSGYAYCGGVVGYNGAIVTNCLAFNVRVAGRAASSAGAVAGYHDTNPSASRLLSNHYRDCTANGASLGIGTGSRGDLPGARSLHLLDLDPTVSASADDTALVTNVLYYAAASSVSLSYSGTPPVGHVLAGYETNSVALPDDVSAFAMPAADISVAPRFRYAVYTIGYDLAGGALPAGASNPETYTMADASFTLANPVRTGYAFAGWTGTDLDGPTNEATVATGSIGDRAYLANWTANAYAVRFHAYDGTAATRDQDFLYDTPQGLDPAGARTGYDFSRWTANADGTGDSYLDGEVVSNLTAAADGVVDLHAQWTPHSYAVRFDANGGDGGSMPDQTGLVYDVATNLDANAFSRVGHDFAGWSTSATGPVVYADGAVVSNLTAAANGSVTLYAQWTLSVYDIVWLDWDGAPLLTNRCEYGSTPAYAGVAPTRAPDATNAWFFVGWTPAIAPVSGPASYLATFSPTSHWALLAKDLAAGGDIVLSRDVTATATDTALLVPAGVTATLDLAGHTIDRALAAPVVGGEAICVAGSLALTNSAPASGAITGGNAAFSGGGVYVEIDGTFTMTGGAISDNSASSSGGGVYVEHDGTFTMTGGKISGNSTGYNGGGVYVFDGGSFAMSGGEISGNSAEGDGGGVYVYGGTFTMNGGEISGNAADFGGGGVYVANGSFAMSGGEISGNTTDDFGNGGGVYVAGGSFTMSGGAISGNSAKSEGGGVFVDNVGTFRMDGGEISGNESYWAGGVEVYGSFTMTDGAISDNSAQSDGGGVFVVPLDGFAMSGGEISGNVAGKRGGGVCFLNARSLFRVSGEPRVLGNVVTNFSDAAAPAVADDIRFRRERSLVWVADALAPEARLGIVPDARRAVTTNLCGLAAAPNGALTNFFSDDPEYALALDDDGEVCIVPPTYALAYVPQDHVAVTVWSVTNRPEHEPTNVADLALAPASFEAAYSPGEPFAIRLDFDPGWFLDLADEDCIRLTVAGGDESGVDVVNSSEFFDGVSLYLVTDGPRAPATLSLALAPFSRTVTFQNVDGTVLQTGPVGYGVVPAYTNNTPVRADPDERHYYAFSGWTPAPAPVVPNLAGGDPAGPVVYTAAYELRDKFAVVVDPNLAHGSVEVVLSSDLSFYSAPVPAGTKLWLLPSVDPGYGVVSLSVAGTNGIPVEANADGSFTMPAFDVIVSATFDEALPISLRKDETAQDAIDGWSVTAGGVWMDPPAAAPGAAVELDFYMASFLFAPTVAVATTNGAEVAFTVSCADEAAGSWSVRFEMPAEPVVVTLSAVPAAFDSLVLLPDTNTVDAASRVFSFVPQETGVYRIAMDGGDLSVYDSLARGLLYGTGEASYVLLAGETYYVTARAGYFWNWDGASRPLVAEKLPDPVVLYSVSADPSIAHGTVRPSVTNAPEGYPVYPTPDPAPGYDYVEDSLGYVCGGTTNWIWDAFDGTPCFYMPDADVVLVAEFEPRIYDVTVRMDAAAEERLLSLQSFVDGKRVLGDNDFFRAPTDAAVALNCYLDMFVLAPTATVTTAGGASVAATVELDGICTWNILFTMPPEPVEVSFSAVPADYPALHEGTNEVDATWGYFTFVPETTGCYSFVAGEGASIDVYDSSGGSLDRFAAGFGLAAGERYYVEYYADGGEGHDIVVTRTADAYFVVVDPAIEHGRAEVMDADFYKEVSGPFPAGTPLYLLFAPDPGYGLASFSVVDTKGVSLATDEWNLFTMPASDVAVSATFARAKAISVEVDEASENRIDDWYCYANGAETDPAAAVPGASVVLYVYLESFVFAPTAAVATAGGAAVASAVEFDEEYGGWFIRFTMPGESVVVSLSTGPADYPPLHEGTNVVEPPYRSRYFTFAPETTGYYSFVAAGSSYFGVVDSFDAGMGMSAGICSTPCLAGERYYVLYGGRDVETEHTIVISMVDEAVATYAVAVDPDIAGGTVTPSVLRAAEGSRVYLTVAEDADTVLGTLLATWTNGTLAIQHGSYGATYFTMPAGDVTVTAEFPRARPLTVVANAKASLYFIEANGTDYKTSPVKVGTNTEVVVNFLCPLGYELRASVATAAGAPVPSEPGEHGNSLAFTMPDEPVVVTASSVRLDLPALVVGDNAVDAAGRIFSFTPSETAKYRFSSENSYLQVYDDQGGLVGWSPDSVSLALVGGETYFIEYEYQGSWDGTAKNLLVEKLGTAVELYRVVVDPGIAGGTIETSVTNAPYDHPVHLRPVPEPGYAYDRGSVAVRYGTAVLSPTDSGDGTFCFCMPDADVTVSALFDLVPLSVAVDTNLAHGSVEVLASEDGQTFAPYAGPVHVGATIRLVATPDPGCRLVSWSVVDATGAPVAVDETGAFAMPGADVAVTAVFEPIPFSVTVDPSLEHGTVKVDVVTAGSGWNLTTTPYDGPVSAGTQIQLSASPDPGYGFVHFSVADTNGVSVAVDEWGVFAMPASDVTVSATFAEALPISVEIAEAAQDAICDWSVSANGIGMDPAAAAPGAAVVLEVFTTLIRYAPTVVVATTNGAAVSAAIECPDETYPCWLAHFTMPSEPVVVSLSAVPATFEELVLLPATNTVDAAARTFSFVPEETGVYRFAMDYSSLRVCDRHDQELFGGYDEMSGALLAGETYCVCVHAGNWDGTPRPLVAEKLPDQVVLYPVFVVVPPNVGGTVRPSVTNAPEGHYVYATPVPEPGYAYVEDSLVYYSYYGMDWLDTAYDGTPYFRMPDDFVFLTAEFEPIPFAVTVDPDIEHGTVEVYVVTEEDGMGNYSASPYTVPVPAGTRIQLSASPDPGYGLASWSVVDTNGVSVEVDEWGYFTMPASDVTVSATFAEALPIVVESDADTSNRVGFVFLSSNGAWIYNPEDFAAVPGATVVLRVAPSFVFAPTATVVTASGAPVEPPIEFLYAGQGEWGGSFTMPAEPVVVTLSLVPADYPPLLVGTNDVDAAWGFFTFTPETTGFYSFAAGEGDGIYVYDSSGNYLYGAEDGFGLVAGERYYVEYYADGDEGHDIVVTKTSDAYAVLVDPAIEHGTVTVSARYFDEQNQYDYWDRCSGPVPAGTEMRLDFTPDPAYGLASWSVVDADGHPVEVDEWGRFTMPASDVTVSAVVARAKAISVEVDEASENRIDDWYCYANGAETDPAAAAPGAAVELSIGMQSFVFAPTATVATASGAAIASAVELDEEYGDWIVRFAMPGEPVVVSLSAGPADYPPLHEGTNDVGAAEAYRARYFTFAPETTGYYELSCDCDADKYYLYVRDSFGSWMDGLPLLAGETYFICYDIPESRETNAIVVTRTDEAVATYAVAVDPSIAGGTVTPSVLLAAEGSRVYLTVAEDADAILGTLRATWTNGTLAIQHGSYGATYFTMPAGDVTVTAEFPRARPLTVVANAKASLYYIEANGTDYETSPVKVATGTNVVVWLWCPIGYELRASAATAAGAPVPSEPGENGYSLAFTMPDAPVVVTVSAVRADLQELVLGDNAVDASDKLFAFTPTETAWYRFSSENGILWVYDDQGDLVGWNRNSVSFALVGGETYFVEYEYQVSWGGTAKNLLVEKLETAVELYRVVVDPGIAGGTIETSVTNAPYGHPVHLRPVPAPGYAYVEGSIVVKFASYVDRPGDMGDGTFGFTIDDCDVVVTALFDPVPFSFPPYLDGADDAVLTNYVNWAAAHGPDYAGTQEASFLLDLPHSAATGELLRATAFEPSAAGWRLELASPLGDLFQPAGLEGTAYLCNGVLVLETAESLSAFSANPANPANPVETRAAIENGRAIIDYDPGSTPPASLFLRPSIRSVAPAP